jgi:sec-independent protein translocase protein TatA
MFGLGPIEIVVIGAIAVMLYGKRLPEVGRSAGKTLGELRRQWSSLAAELDVAAHIEGRPSRAPSVRPGSRADEGDAALVAGPRFDPPADPAA